MVTTNEIQRVHGLLRHGAIASFAALMLGLVASRPAQSTPAYSVNAYVSSYAAGNPNSTPTPYEPVGATEYFDGEGILQQAFSVGGPPENDDLGCCSTFNHPVPTVPSVTSVTLGTSSVNSPDGVSANASAYANLATGSLGVSGNSNEVGYAGGNSNEAAALADTLTFSITGATSSTVTTIGVQWSVSGGVTSSSADSGGDAEMEGNLQFGNAGMTTEWDSDDGGAPTDYLGTGADGDWLSSTIVSQTANSTIIDAEYQLVGSDPTIPVGLFLECGSSNDASCDYYDTASISLTLPAGVSFTSASGVFLTQAPVTAVPEPGSFLLFGTALLAIGSLRRCKSLPFIGRE
jgi:hypothetical protein